MRKFSRYAIYYVPEVGSGLAEFGASWLGWNAENGQAVAHPDDADLPLSIDEMTATPRKYGMHGTLKPPFNLSVGYAVTDLDEAIGTLASQQKAFEVAPVSLTSISGFLAITPEQECPKLANLAETCVRQLDAFRASPSEHELARRRSANLSASQENNLMRWGYPYVFEEFRFHLTLTGKLAPDVIKSVSQRIRCDLAAVLCEPLPVREICLSREDKNGNFHVVKRYALAA